MGGYRWNEKEIDILKDMYGSQTIAHVKTALFKASGIRRDYNAIRKKASRIGLEVASNRCEFLTAGDIAENMGYHKTTVVKTWREWGLKIKVSVLINTKTITQIKPNDFWEFAYENRHRIDFSKYQQGSILPEPSWLKEELKEKQERSRKPLDQHKEAQIIALRKIGLTNRQIAEKLGLTEQRLQTALRALHKNEKLKRERIRIMFSEEELKIIKEMAEKGYLIKDIAEEVSRDANTVGKKIRALKKKGEWEKIGC